MRVKSFVGGTMQEAVAKMKAEFGEDAVILHTKRVKAPGLLSFIIPSRIEVIAALEERNARSNVHLRNLGAGRRAAGAYSRGQAPGTVSEKAPLYGGKSDEAKSSSGLTTGPVQPLNRALQIDAEGGRGRNSEITSPNGQQVGLGGNPHVSLKPGASVKQTHGTRAAQPHRQAAQSDTQLARTDAVEELFQKNDVSELPPYLRAVAKKLKKADVEERLAVALVRSIAEELPADRQLDADYVNRKLKERISHVFKVDRPWDFQNGPEVVALVGPTGVGKTTTIAKLAANYALLSGKRVGLVTMDTYRIAAVDQLRTYAEIIGVPLEVVFTPEELREAVNEALNECELVLIDTAGRSQRNAMQMAELKTFLAGVPLSQIHLVLSAATRYQDLVDIVTKFSVLGLTHLIFTKLDETSVYGGILNAYALVKKPLSYLTDGQNVPENIEAADADRIADLILGRVTL